MGACCQVKANKKKEYEIENYELYDKKQISQQHKITKQQNSYKQDQFLPPKTYLKGKGVSIGSGQTQEKTKLTQEEIKQKQLEAAEKRLENNKNRGLTTQAQVDMIFKAERAENAQKFKNENEQYYLKYK